MKRLFFIIVLLPSLFFAQHSIKGVFYPAKDYNMALLYKVTPTISEYITNSIIKEDGTFHFKLDSTVTKGVLRVVYAIPQEDYNFDIIYNGKEDIELVFNTETGVSFKKSSENKMLATYLGSMAEITHRITKFYRQKNEDSLALVSIYKAQNETQSHFEKLAKNTIALSFIKANKPYIPKGFENVETYSKNIKKHYFDNINFNDSILVSSNFLEERMLNYVYGMHSKTEDDETNYKNNIDVFCKAMVKAPIKTKRILLLNLWEQMGDLNFDNVANYISVNYLIGIAESLKDKDLVKELTLFKNLSMGQKAPDFSVEVEVENKSKVKEKKKVVKKLSELNSAKNYIIVFWSSTCSHCLSEIPKLHAYVKSQKAGTFKVIAIGLEEEPYKWKNLTYELPEFIHVYGEGKWDNEIADLYDVPSTPTYFVLDKDKKIIGKPEHFEDLEKMYMVEK